MKTSSTDNRLALYKAHYAMIVAEDALASLAYLSETQAGRDDEFLGKLWTAFYVNYVRSFSRLKSSNREGCLSRLVPDGYRGVHDDINLCRNQIAADIDRSDFEGGDAPSVPAFEFKFPDQVPQFQLYLECVKGVREKMGVEMNEPYASLPSDTKSRDQVERLTQAESVLLTSD